MNTLGIVAHTLGYGDAAAALAVGNEIVGVVEEERFSRIRYDAGFPKESILWLLQRAGLSGSDIDGVTLHLHPKRGLYNRLYWMARHPVDTLRNCGDYLRGLGELGSLRAELAQVLGRPDIRITTHPHHLCHAAAAFYPSGFESAACLILDGAGEGLVGIIARADRKNGLRVMRTFRYPHSLGLLYSAICDHIGFPPPGGPGKVMGLAPYGDPQRFLPLLRTMASVRDNALELDLSYFAFHRNLVTPLTPKPWVSEKLIRESGLPSRGRDDDLLQAHMDLAAALQIRTNEIGLELTRAAVALTGERNLCIGGGVALNSVMNGIIAHSGVADQVFIQPAAGDAGNAVGSVILEALSRDLAAPQFACMPYAGPAFSADDIEAALLRHGLTYRRSENIAVEAAEAIHSGKIVSWFQGRMEYGPRALGARSILADPKNPNMRDIINHKVKHREWFRPFAPSVIQEAYSRYFTGPINNPFMLIVSSVKAEWRDVLQAITHVDGTARPQSVTREANPRYYDLLVHLGRISGHPVVLNTSFNDSEPIVCSPDDAIACFIDTEVDLLCIGDFVISKAQSCGIR